MRISNITLYLLASSGDEEAKAYCKEWQDMSRLVCNNKTVELAISFDPNRGIDLDMLRTNDYNAFIQELGL